MRSILFAAALIASIHAKKDDKLLLVPVHVAGKGPFWFCVDSGAPHTVIDPWLMKQLHLKPLSSATTRGTGQGDVGVEHVRPLRMSIGGAHVTIAEPWVIDLSGVPISKSVHGLVGAEFFESFVVELDSDARAVRFFDAQRYAADAAAIPIEVENHRFFMNVKIEVNESETVEHKLRIDTGSGDAIADEVVRKGRNPRQTVIGRGLGQDFTAVSGMLKAVHIGPFTFRDVWGPGAPHPAIGMEMFRRFTTIFDVPHRRMYLVPNRHFNEPIPAPN